MDIKDLINLAKINKAGESRKDIPEVKRFIHAFNVRPGKTKVLNGIIYRAYKLWSKKPMKPTSFFKQFSQYFTSCKSHGMRFYLLTQDAYRMDVISEKMKDEYEG